MSEKYINIDGNVKHRFNSEGDTIHHTDEGIRNFYKWFGDSTATDDQGRPRVFYHGTDAKFDTFKPQPAKTSTIFGVEDVERQGHFFTPSLDFAKEYTKSGNVMKVYLKMHKPFDMRNGITSDMYDTMDKHGINPRWLISNHIDDWERFDGEDGKHFKEALHNSGHDSAIIFEPHGKEAREAHIVFHPNQIKSATSNEGNFDMSKESINESIEHPMIDVDGEMKHRHNSNGAPIHHTDEGIKNFHRWFGNSKVVDKHGRPLVVYHGTRTSFDAFEHGKGKFTDTGVSGKGFYFTPKADYADAYGRNENGANIMPVYLKLENPFIHKGSKTEELFTKFAGKRPNDYWNTDWSEKVTKGLKSIGHDGYMDSDYDLKNNGLEFVAFHPSQIKSTIGNSGTFAHPTRITEDAEHPMIDVDGEMKHRHNSNGQPIHHTDEGIRNFHKWFDKSKAVDEHGRPQVFYHGTTHNFKSFDTSKSGQKDHGWYGVGHYFTPNVYTASAYSTYDKNKTTGANVMPVYLKLHNPYKWSHDIPAKKTSEESMEATMNMRNAGYDGVFAENKYVNPEHENFYEVVAFHPHQIKSALGNTGEFKHSNNINENMQTSNEFPEEAIVGHLKSMRDSGRYKIEHNGFNDRYNYHEFTVTSKPPLNAVHFHLQKGRNSPSWFNPDMAELHTPYPEDPYTRTYARLKTNVGFTPEINEQRTPGVLYRGMSEEEFKNIKSTGVIKSRGDYNLEGQEGLTYYSRDPGQAAHYAHGFAPAQFKASGRHNVYVVAVKDPNTEVKVAGTGEDEVGIPHAISAEDILHVHVGKAYASYPGSHSINKDSWNKEPHEGKYSEGSSSAPSTMIGWKKKNFEEL